MVVGAKIKQTDILIIGGGLSGLAATWQLLSAGVNTVLVEARNRFGGRILTVGGEHNADCDLGPSWFWPGQPLVEGLLEHFKIPHHAQYVDGDILLQRAGGQIERSAGPSPMTGSRRIQGGVGRLVDAISDQIDAARCLLEHRVTGLSIDRDVVYADIEGPSGQLQIQAGQVAVAIPPRLAAGIKYTPELPAEILQTLVATPTWMAGHAKFFALYETPFWRQQGLCGTVLSQRGPLSEIHDASPETANSFSLFGFSGLDVNSRQRLGRAEFINQATTQLENLFGEQAKNPRVVYLQDWSRERLTASIADHSAQIHHPRYGLSLQPDNDWAGKIDFISTETSFRNGGLIEGALESGLGFARGVDKRLVDDS